jgi:hypothetical protein
MSGARSLSLSSLVILSAMTSACNRSPIASGESESETGTTATGSTESGNGDGDPSGDGDGDGDPWGDGDGDRDLPDWNCGESISFVASYTPPNVMLVVDASSSMVASVWDHDADALTADVTRWSSVHAVVETSTTEFQDFVQAGIQRFPSTDACPDATPQDPNCYDANACITAAMPEVSLALSNGAAILAGIPGPDADNVEIIGATPTGRAFDAARAHLLAQPPEPSRHILLITDGAPNCDDALAFPDLLEVYDETLAGKVESAHLDDDITTHVFGVEVLDELQGIEPDDGEAEANPVARLDELAQAGGAQFYNSSNQAELLAAVTDVLDELTNCRIDLTTSPIGLPEPRFVSYVQVYSDGIQVPWLFPGDCETADGWTWIEFGLTLAFCGSYCDAMRTGDPPLEVIYACPPE